MILINDTWGDKAMEGGSFPKGQCYLGVLYVTRGLSRPYSPKAPPMLKSTKAINIHIANMYVTQ